MLQLIKRCPDYAEGYKAYGDQLDEEMYKDHVGKVSAKTFHAPLRIDDQAHWVMLKRWSWHTIQRISTG